MLGRLRRSSRRFATFPSLCARVPMWWQAVVMVGRQSMAALILLCEATIHPLTAVGPSTDWISTHGPQGPQTPRALAAEIAKPWDHWSAPGAASKRQKTTHTSDFVCL